MSATKKVMLSALQPTNRITLGNYIGAIKNWVKLSQEYDCLFFAVDQHAITAHIEPAILRDRTLRAVATYIAAGLDPKNVTLFVQSHVPAHAELGWVLTCHAYMGELSRMTQYKDKAQKHDESIPAGLFMYPVLMAADILLYQSELIPVGADQKQHVELARDLAERMNNKYTPKAPKGETALFKMPQPWIPPVGARIMSLQDPLKKMSKSDPDPHATLFMDDTDKDIEKKLKRAVTDSGSEITESDDKPGVKNLLAIQSALTGQPVSQIVESYVGKMYGHLKLDTARICVEAIAPIRTEVDRLMADPAYLTGVLKLGAERAQARAEPTLKRVYDLLGLIPRN